MDIMEINSNEEISTQENLKNKKKWFNGDKEFSSIKVTPPLDNTLAISVIDDVMTLTRVGG